MSDAGKEERWDWPRGWADRPVSSNGHWWRIHLSRRKPGFSPTRIPYLAQTPACRPPTGIRHQCQCWVWASFDVQSIQDPRRSSPGQARGLLGKGDT